MLRAHSRGDPLYVLTANGGGANANEPYEENTSSTTALRPTRRTSPPLVTALMRVRSMPFTGAIQERAMYCTIIHKPAAS